MSVVINQSRVKAWRQCHRQHWFKYVEKIVPRRVKRPFMFGGVVHKMLEADANGDDPWDKLNEIVEGNRKMFRAEIEVYGDIVGDLIYIMSDYFKYWRDDPIRFIRFNKRSAEHTFRIDLMPGIVWKGTIDGFARAKDLKWLVEHKTMKSEWTEDDRWRNIQSVTYRTAANMMGWPSTEGIMWNYILSKPPTRTLVNSDGTINKRKAVTLPSVPLDMFKKGEIGSAVYKQLDDAAQQGLSRYFQRVFTPATAAVEKAIFSDFKETAIEIAEQGNKKKTMNIGRHCSFCAYEGLCRTELQDGDLEYIKNHDFMPDPEAE